jgi:Mn2+/Fe2+ NRAMP family transporter
MARRFLMPLPVSARLVAIITIVGGIIAPIGFFIGARVGRSQARTASV